MTPVLLSTLETLATGSEDRAGRARVLKRRGADVALIVGEINDTVLPVILRFDTGPSALSLHVAGRRLHRIIKGEGELDVPKDLLGTPLSMENTGLRKTLAALLQDLANNAAYLHVTSTRATDVTDDQGDSLSLPALIKDLELEPEPDDADQPLFDRLVARTGDQIIAHVQLKNGQIVTGDGAATDVASLKAIALTQLAAFLTSRTTNCPSHSDPSLTVFSDVLENGQSVGVVSDSSETLIFASKSGSYNHLLRAFSRLV